MLKNSDFLVGIGFKRLKKGNMKEEEKFFMVNVASGVLEYRNKHPKKMPEDIIKKVVDSFQEKKVYPDLKLLAVAASNEIIRLKDNNQKENNKQLLQKFVDNLDGVLKNLKVEE